MDRFRIIRSCGAAVLMLGALVSCRQRHREEFAPIEPDRARMPSVLPAEPPTLAPEMKKVLEALASLGGKPIETLTPSEARQQPTPADAVKKILQSENKPTDPEPVAKIENRTIPGPAGDLAIRVYSPAGNGRFPVLVYIHGGGWVLATIDRYDSSARALCNAASCVVVSVEYRKAPEAKFPAAHDDAFAAYKWIVQNAGQINGDDRRIAVAGESAGGNMAAVIAQRARSAGLKPPRHQLLIYPVAGHNFNTPSYQRNASAKPLNKAMMAWFFGHYLSASDQGNDPRITLTNFGNLGGLASATVITAEIDPLMSEGKAYADALAAAGVDVKYRGFPGVTHEFFGMGAVLPQARDAVTFAASRLKEAFAQ
jgi:acetyl esterase/lipase